MSTSENDGAGIETVTGAVTRLKCDGPNGCDDGAFEYKGSLASKLISVACCGCGTIRKVEGPVEVLTATGEKKILEWHEDDVQKRVALEGETPEDRKRITFTLPASVHARFIYARKLYAHLNNGNASTAKYFEMSCEEFIQAHEHEVPEALRGDVPPPATDEHLQTDLPLDADDACLPVADGELAETDGSDGLEFEDEDDPSADAPEVPDPGEYRAEAGAEPDDLEAAPTADEPKVPEGAGPGWTPRVVTATDEPEPEGEPQPVDDRVKERVEELEQEVNATLVDLAHGLGLVATARMPKRLLIRMIVNAEFPHASTQE